jgi:hypothetical protein
MYGNKTVTGLLHCAKQHQDNLMKIMKFQVSEKLTAVCKLTFACPSSIPSLLTCLLKPKDQK